MPSRLAPPLFTLLSLLSAVAGAAGSAHEHGVATLQIVVVGDTLQATLEIPAHDVVGFEHAPTTPTQRAAVATALAKLQLAGRVIAPSPDAGCSPAATQIEAAPGHADRPADEHHAHADDAHADFRLGYTLRCAQPAALDTATTGLFTLLPDLAQLRVQIIGPRGASDRLLTRPDGVIEIGGD